MKWKIFRKKMNREELINFFLNENEHDWIRSNVFIQRNFLYLFKMMPENVLMEFLEKKPLFLMTSGFLGAAIEMSTKRPLVMIYPDLYQILISASPDRGLAILSHEIGHIILGHSQQKISVLEAQVEADHFAYTLGLGKELHDVLLQFKGGVDVSVRIAKLTSWIIADQY